MNFKPIYLDHAATTYVDPVVKEAMEPFFYDKCFNPSSVYTVARECANYMTEARANVAKWINAEDPNEIIFTSGGSESDNMAVYGISMAYRHKGRHIITTPIEHHAVLHAVEGMEIHGFDHSLVPVDEYGIVDLEELKKAIREDTVLVSVMMANNEVGAIEPIKEIGKICREKGVIFHTDAVQAVGALPIDVQEMNIDALSMSAHKFYGPKGVGVFYLRNGVKMIPLIRGGSQEKGRRAGTHNTAGIVGLGKAIDLACSQMKENNRRITRLRDKLIKGITERLPDVKLNGHPTKRLPNNANFIFKYIESEAVLLHLNTMGICASAGSACSSESEDPSHVLKAMGVPASEARGSLRLTLGKGTTEKEIDFTIDAVVKVVENLRKMSPLIPG